jgi:prepilin-type N-terminal cleavage/methylation domain-containing protein
VTPKASPLPRGFTLLEILIAMSLFTVIGLGVVLLMRTGIEMYVQGSQASQGEDRREQSLPRLEEDLRHVLVPAQIDRIPFDAKNPDPAEEPDALPPENRFISGYQLFRFGEKDVACRYLAFVRDITGLGEIETYASRAGTNALADAYIDGKDDEQEFRANRHLPTGGAVEVLWIWLPDEKRLGVGTAYRAYRSPIGGADTLLDPQNYAELDKLYRVIRPQPVFQDVALFDLLFWTQWTTNWDWSAGEPSVRGPPREPDEWKGGRPACGPSLVWDSTRGILTGQGSWPFHLAKGTLRFAADDIWPRAVRIGFALSETETALSQSISAGDVAFTVLAGDFATGRGELDGQFMKIGTEWVQISQRDGKRRDTFLVAARGARGTTAVAHAAGEPVYYGRVFDFTMQIPSFRDDNN